MWYIKCDYHIVLGSEGSISNIDRRSSKLEDQDVRKLSEWLGCEVNNTVGVNEEMIKRYVKYQ